MRAIKLNIKDKGNFLTNDVVNFYKEIIKRENYAKIYSIMESCLKEPVHIRFITSTETNFFHPLSSTPPDNSYSKKYAVLIDTTKTVGKINIDIYSNGDIVFTFLVWDFKTIEYSNFYVQLFKQFTNNLILRQTVEDYFVLYSKIVTEMDDLAKEVDDYRDRLFKLKEKLEGLTGDSEEC